MGCSLEENCVTGNDGDVRENRRPVAESGVLRDQLYVVTELWNTDQCDDGTPRPLPVQAGMHPPGLARGQLGMSNPHPGTRRF
ncbi:hypothetical protein ACOJVU_14315 [Mycobacterium sp. THU-M104]|uniref:hypothetical protein n=1 Tax=Mycobacterium sp. THU-M104 TaxID=3410515 RepID=UPI003B9C656C